MSYKVRRRTWGGNIARSINILFHGKTRIDCDSFILRDAIRMMDIGYEFKDGKGHRVIDGREDFCEYEVCDA